MGAKGPRAHAGDRLNGATLPFSWYVEPDVLRAERDAIFRRAWQYVARAGQLAEPGSYVAARVGDLPVVVVLGEDDVLRAFANVCRHRGHELVAGEGRRASLQCPYHAWTYGLDGRLRAAPRAEREPGFDVDGLSLAAVAVETWGPFVFASPEPEAPLAEALGDLPEALDLEGLAFHERAAWPVEANWKVVLENFLECYHCGVAHPGFSQLVDVRPDAYRLEQSGPLLSQFGTVKAGEAEAEPQFHLIWPSTVVNVMPGRRNLSIGPVLPSGPGRSERFLDYFFAEGEDEAWIAEFRAFDDQVGREDEALVESVQRGMASGLVERGVLLPESEQLVAAFQARVADALA